MKRILLFSILLFLVQILFAQTSPDPCDTLVLKNDRIISVTIDSIAGGKVFYKKCPTDNSPQENLEVNFIKPSNNIGFISEWSK